MAKRNFLLKRIWQKQAAHFESAYDLSESIDRLKAVTQRRAWLPYGLLIYVPANYIFHGFVSRDKVLLHLYPRWPNQSSGFGTAWFRGQFKTHEGNVVLVGYFSMYIIDKILMTMLVGIVFVAFTLGLLSFLPHGHQNIIARFLDSMGGPNTALLLIPIPGVLFLFLPALIDMEGSGIFISEKIGKILTP